MLQEWVIASNNSGKVRELKALLKSFPIKLRAQAEFNIEEVAETGKTFVENALLKARHASAVTGLPAIADDAGLCVTALKGAPGLYSARYAATAEARLQKLLAALSAVADRSAFFYCCVVFLRHADDPAPLLGIGEWHGEIALAASGNGGFGYDPIFYLPELKKTAAELTAEEKNKLSHRGQALRQLLQALSANHLILS